MLSTAKNSENDMFSEVFCYFSGKNGTFTHPQTQTVRSGKEAYDRRAESSRAADGERIPHIVSQGEDTHCGQGGFGEKQAAAVCVKSGDGRLGFCHHRAVELCKDSRIAGASGTAMKAVRKNVERFQPKREQKSYKPRPANGADKGGK